MADVSDVETALVHTVVAMLYPGGTKVPSATGQDVKIYRGWPAPIGLNADLANGISNVSIFSDAKMFRETTRYPEIWRQVSMMAPTLTATTRGSSVTFGGYGAIGQVAGVRVDDDLYSVASSSVDTPTTIASSLCAMITGSASSGPNLTIATAHVVEGRVASSGVSSLETRRQEQGFVISFWCADPVTRDSLASFVDSSLSVINWLEFTDGSAGQLRYRGSTVIDTAENANLYRRDLSYTVEYPTIIFRTSSAMLFGRTNLDGPVASVPAPVSTLRNGIASLLGAIRFDAWYDPQDTIDQQCAAALSPETWVDRLPPNSIVSNGSVSWPLATQQTLDLEISAAARAGLAFWAFDSYSPTDGLTRALSLYLTSSLRDQLQFCMLGQSSNWADPSTPSGYSAALLRDVTMMTQTGYLNVIEGRPVYFVLDASADQVASLPAGGVAQAIATIRQEAVSQGVGNPYIVWLSGAALEDYDNVQAARDAGADAAGAYACPRLNGTTQAYASLVASTEQDWANRASTGFSMVATAMTGWDQRPLVETPQAFYPLSSNDNSFNFYEAGAVTEIAAHVSRLRSFTATTTGSCPAGIGLIYAWNELVEGGWLMPTFGGLAANMSRVEALRLSLGDWLPGDAPVSIIT